MSFHTLFIIVFLSQILLISYYLPRKMFGKIVATLESHPPSTYPKLYPTSFASMMRYLRAIRWLNYGIFLVGMFLWYTVFSWDPSLAINEKRPAVIAGVFGVVQFTPFIMVEISQFRQFKMMRKADSRTRRMAQLSPRSLFSFISPVYVLLAVFMYLALIAFKLFFPSGNFHVDTNAALSIAIVTAGNGFLAAIGFYHLRGKKLDPHQSHADRLAQIEIIARVVVGMSILMSWFAIVNGALQEFGLNQFKGVLHSVYFQILAFASVGATMRLLNAKHIDFDVYRDDAIRT